MSSTPQAGYSPGGDGQETWGDRSSASIGELLADVSRDLTLLMKQEVELAKAEALQSVSRAGKGAGMLGGAGVAAHLALVFISVAVWWALGDAIGRGWSGLVVAVIWALIAVGLAVLGRREVRAVRGVRLPQTVDAARKIPAAMVGKEERTQ